MYFFFLTFRWFSHYWRSTAMPWCCNTTQLNIYYLHSISTQQRDLFFPGRGGGTQVCRSCIDWQLSRYFTHLDTHRHAVVNIILITLKEKSFQTETSTVSFMFCLRWCGSSSWCEQDKTHSTSHNIRYSQLKWKERERYGERDVLCVSNCCLDMWLTREHCIRGYTEVNSPVCHKFRPTALSWSTQQRSHDRLSAQYFFLPPSSFDWFKIMVVLLTVSPA